MINIRKALPSDIDALTNILNQAIREGGATAILSELKPEDRNEWFETHQYDPYAIFVAEVNNEVAGYLSLGPYRKGRKALQSTAEVSYFLDYRFHRQGIASQLLKKAMSYSEQQEIKNLVAFLYSTNEASVEFMKKNGFELWGMFPKAIVVNGIEIDHVIYGKRLTNL